MLYIQLIYNEIILLYGYEPNTLALSVGKAFNQYTCKQNKSTCTMTYLALS